MPRVNDVNRLRLTRRELLAGATAAAALGPASAMAQAVGGRPAPSDRLTLGFIGVGMRGTYLLGEMLKKGSAQVVAVCDPYGSKRAAAAKLVDQHYQAPAGRGCTAFEDYRELLARNDIDAVVVASPEHWHGLHGIHAVAAGKDIYLEKSLALTFREGQKLAQSTRQSKRVLQVGLQQRSANEFRQACEIARSGLLGQLHTVKVAVPESRLVPSPTGAPIPADLNYDLWLGPAPMAPYNDQRCVNWFFIHAYSLGFLQLWGVHHLDVALWGAPALGQGRLQVSGTAKLPEPGGLTDTVLAWKVECAAGGLRLLYANDGVYQQGCRFEGSEGWVHVTRDALTAEPASLLGAAIPEAARLTRSLDHLDDFLASVRERREPVAPVEAGLAATTIPILADISVRLQRPLLWDWQAQHCVNDDEANRLLARPMRAPWVL